MESRSGRTHYLNADYGVRSWLLTTDHKRIALLYLVSITVMFMLGGLFAVAIRLELLTPRGDLVQSDTYNKLFTMHGVIMVFFFLIPSIPAVLGNFLLPMMIGARDLAFPRLNLLSWYLYVIGALFTLWVMVTGGVDTGWTFYTPYSTAASATRVIPTAIGIFITGFSSILTGLNFIATVHTMRAPGLTWFRLPLFVWAHYATSIIMLLGTPVIAVTLAMVGLERGFHIGNDLFVRAAGGGLAGILGFERRPLVSADYCNDTRSAIVDGPSTMVTDGTLLKVYAWYDNEMGYVCRMVDLANIVMERGA